MLSHSKRESKNWSEDSLTHHKHSTFGLKFKSCGRVWSQSSQEVISPSRCLFKPSNSQVSTRLGWNAWKNLSKLKKFSNAASWICSRTICLTCKRSWKNARNYWKLICRVKENCSQDFISSQILHCSRYCHKVQNLHQSKKTSKSCLMLSLRLNLENQTRKVQTKKLFWQSFRKQVVQKKCHWQLLSDVKDWSNLGCCLCKRKCKKQWENTAELLQPKFWVNLWKLSSRAVYHKWVCWVFNCSGPKRSPKLLKKARKKIRVPSNQRRKKSKKCWSN